MGPMHGKRREWLTRLEAWLWSEAVRPAPTLAEVAELVCDLSDLYTVERGVLARQQGGRGHLLAKSLYFLAADAPKVVASLDECDARAERLVPRALEAEPEPLRVVDVGCGVGATSVGFLLWHASRNNGDGRPIDITGIDSEPAVLSLWANTVRAAAELVGLPVSLRTFAEDGFGAGPSRAWPERPDLILCQTALNERLPGNQTGELVHEPAVVACVARWAAMAPTLLIEPALRVATRALQRLRDELVEDPAIRVIAPCPHRAACPMLAQPRDWCHESRRWEPTPRVAEVQARTRRRDDLLLWSYLAIAPRSRVDADEAAAPRRWRLVSDPLGSRGKTERWVCCDDGRLRMVRVLDRERSEANAPLVDAERGVLVTLPQLPESDRIGPSVEVQAPSL